MTKVLSHDDRVWNRDMRGYRACRADANDDENTCGVLRMVPIITPIMENQMEKKMENEMETGII